MNVNINDKNISQISAFNSEDKNERVLRISVQTSDLLFHDNTAEKKKILDQGQDEVEITLKITSYPKSMVRQSTVQIEEKDLYMEKLSNIIFKKEISQLRHFEFIRSPIVQIEFEDYTYNHFFFNRFPKLQIIYNKIDKYPNFFLTEEEDKQQMKEYEMPYSINDPSNYYCLGYFIEDQNEWKCISRNLIEINDSIVEFNFPFPGVYAVIFCPIHFEKDETFTCDFVCQYRKNIFLFVLLLIPLIYLSVNYILQVYGKDI